MKKFLIPLCAFAALAAGCSRNQAGIEPPGTPEQIVLGSGVTAGTRASVESDDDGVIESHTSLDVAFIRAADGAAADWQADLHADQTAAGTGAGRITAQLLPTTAAAGSNSVTFTVPQFYSGNPTLKAHLRGYYPADAVLSYDGTGNVTEATWTVDGKTDLLASDYVSGYKGIASAVPVTFKHLLSKLTVKVIAENDGAKAGWGEVKSMQIQSVPQNVKILFDGVAGTQWTGIPIASPTADISVWGHKAADNSTTDAAPAQLELPVAGSGTAAVFGQTLVAPQGSYVIKIATTAHGATEYATSTVTIPGGAQAGHNHIITLTFKAGEIVATAVVTAWEDGQDATGEVN